MENLYANVPRNLSRVKSKVFLNLTARQLLCFGTAVLIGVPLFFASRSRLGTTPASLIMIAVMLPFFFLAMYEKNGYPAEVILKHYIDARFRRPRKRVYQTDNVYAAAERAANVREEVNSIVLVQENERKGTGKGHGKERKQNTRKKGGNGRTERTETQP